jgi:drug/metabolite transporter (DMT)-like permease
MLWQLIHTGEFYATACALCWAVGVVLFRKSGEQVPPVPLNLFKNLLGSILMAVTMLIGGRPFIPADQGISEWGLMLFSGVLGIGIADTLIFAALNRIGAGRAAIVACLYSPTVLLCSLIYLQEPMGTPLLVSMGLMGVAILLGAWKPDKREPSTDLAMGIILGILGVVFVAVAIVMVKPVLNHCDAWWATLVRLVGGLLLLLFQSSASAKHRHEAIRCFWPSRLWRVTVPASVVGTYLAMLLWVLGMKYTYTTVASVLNQMSNIFILVLATLFLREPLTWRKMVAILLGFGAGVVVVI